MSLRFLLVFFLMASGRLFSAQWSVATLESGEQIKVIQLSETEFSELVSRPHPILSLFKKKQKNNRRYTAALIAFPFPFGIVGLHRIYLGSAPYVPIVYIASLGGVFGLIPLIDCIVLLADKNFEKYENSPKVFMWID